MLVSPSLAYQLDLLSRINEDKVFVGCVLDYDKTTLVSLVEASSDQDYQILTNQLPLNLCPAAILFLSNQ